MPTVDKCTKMYGEFSAHSTPNFLYARNRFQRSVPRVSTNSKSQQRSAKVSNFYRSAKRSAKVSNFKPRSAIFYNYRRTAYYLKKMFVKRWESFFLPIGAIFFTLDMKLCQFNFFILKLKCDWNDYMGMVEVILERNFEEYKIYFIKVMLCLWIIIIS